MTSALYHLCHPTRPGIVLYIGRSKNPSVRLIEHRTGACKTTAKGARRDGLDILEIEMTTIRWFDDETDPDAEGNEIDRLQAIGQSLWNFPYAFSAEDIAKGSAKAKAINAANNHPGLKKAHAISAARGYPGIKKGLATNAANGYSKQKEVLAKVRMTQAANGYPELKRGRAILAGNRYSALKQTWTANKARGYPGLKKARAIEAANGYPGLKKATHVRCHVNRGIINSNCPLCIWLKT